MAQSILELIFRSSHQGTGGKKAAEELRNLKGTVGEVTSGLLGLNMGSVTAAGAVLAIGSFAKESVSNWSAYAESMGKAADASGIGADEMSRIAQAADDMRVPIESVTQAFKLALKNGFQPTIENLATLADSLKGMDPLERAATLTKIFGKSWQDVYPLLKDGGQAIRDGTAAIADNLVVTETAVAKNREYIKAVDDLGDAWTGVQNQLAQGVIPAITDVIETIAAGEGPMQLLMQLFPDLLTTAAERAGEAREATAGWSREINQIPVATAAAIPAVDGLTESAINVSAAFDALTARMIFNQAAAGLDTEAQLALGRSLGLVDETSAYALAAIDQLTQQYAAGKLTEEEYIDRLTTIRNTIDGIQSKTVRVQVDTYYNTIDETGKNLSPKQQDYRDFMPGGANAGTFTVPAGYPNDSFMLRLSSGETANITNDRMRWTGDSPAGGGGASVVIQNVNISGGMDMAEFESRLIRLMKR